MWCKNSRLQLLTVIKAFEYHMCFELYSFERMAEVSARLEQHFPINCNDKSMAMRISPNK